MRIGIDARFFGPKQKGLGRYVQRLIEELTEFSIFNFQFSNYKFVIFLRKENFNDFQPSNPNFKKVLADWRWYTIAEQLFMPFIIRREKVDLMHFPHFNVPVFCPTKFVVTIHDLVLKKFPTKRATTLNPPIYKIKELGYKVVLNWAVKRAQKIITPSNFTKNEILSYFKIKPEKIEVIYEGAPQPNFVLQNLAGEIRNPKSEILKKYNIEKPYILYVGNAYPHKNLEGLLRAYSLICANKDANMCEYEGDVQLVLVGEMDYFYKRLKQLTIQQFNNLTTGKQVVFTGFVSDDELPELYKNAVLYVSPAFSEGFGLPALEAMNYGLPVAASGTGAQPEILGKAALYFKPEDIEDMAEKMSILLKNKNQRKDLIVRGYEQIKKYSWQKMAEEILKLYKTETVE